MQYLLMIYGNEAGMLAASKEMVTQMKAGIGFLPFCSCCAST